MIQIKRGLINNLPLLNAGEPAFTTDSKELYIGDGSSNFLLSSTHRNLFINSNFQISTDDFTPPTSNITLLPGEQRYIYGNYYIKNLATSTTNIVISRTFQDGYITINATNANIVLEYREKLAKYDSTAGTVTYIKPLKNKQVTLSYNINNKLSTVMSNLKAGYARNLTTFSINKGIQRTSITFNMDYDDNDYYPLMRVVLFSTTTNSNLSFSIGNLKLELGNTATKYSPLPFYYELAALNQVFTAFSYTLRACQTTPTTISYFIPFNIPSYFNYNVSVRIKKYTLASILGALLTDFTMSYYYNPTLLGLEVTFTKTAHGITDSYLNIFGYIDLRP